MFQHFITSYGYLAVFVLMLAESACIPIPSEVIMLFGGALAAGAVPGAHLSLAGIVIAGVLGNVVGSYVAWAVGKYAGQPAVLRWGGRFGLRAHDIDRATRWFEKYGPAAVLAGRLVPVIRTFISLPAGFANMPAVRFGLYTTLGCIPWTAALGIAGYALGANWQHVANDFHGPTYVIAGVIIVALAVAVILHFRRRRRIGGGTTAPAPFPPGGQERGTQAPASYAPRMESPRTQGPQTQGPQTQGPQTQGPQTQGPRTQAPGYQWAPPPGDRHYR